MPKNLFHPLRGGRTLRAYAGSANNDVNFRIVKDFPIRTVSKPQTSERRIADLLGLRRVENAVS